MSNTKEPKAYAVETIDGSTKLFNADELEAAQHMFDCCGASMFALYMRPVEQAPLTEEEIIELGFKAGFCMDYVENEGSGESDFGFIDDEGQIMNELFIKFARLIENRIKE